MKPSPTFYGCGRIASAFRTRNNFVAGCYGKVDLGCQAGLPGGLALIEPSVLCALIAISYQYIRRDAGS
jgi:hypothetical protein